LVFREPDIFAMMSQVTKMLKENPEIINKVNKMVSGVMNNKELIESLFNLEYFTFCS
jgi:uncharacterized protein YoxC